jgi:hypothetical protein
VVLERRLLSERTLAERKTVVFRSDLSRTEFPV